jgi:uncharacterized repeat protein (TIGR03803 family)
MSRYTLLLTAVLVSLMGGTGVQAARLRTLHSFCSQPQGSECLDGKTPVSRLVEIEGELYGTASTGGSTLSGTLFRVSPAGDFTLLHTFCRQAHCSDGAKPGNYLTRGPSGAVYGVTTSGGRADGGAIFKFSKTGEFSLVYEFCSAARCSDGIQPVSVLFGGAGDLFGTTAAGGRHGGGTAFMIDTHGAFHVLHDFCSETGCTDGASPGALMRGRDGNFYGTTLAGGPNHAGTVFRMTPTGRTKVLYSFCGTNRCPDGEQPAPLLVEGQNGDFYGTTAQRGRNSRGTIFEVSPAGVLHTLHTFCANANCADGATPMDGLVLAKDGSLYGTASGGGQFYNGVVFHLTAAGKYSIAYNFCALHGCFDGTIPGSSPIVGSDGALYGTTQAGGDRGGVGMAYRLVP